MLRISSLIKQNMLLNYFVETVCRNLNKKYLIFEIIKLRGIIIINGDLILWSLWAAFIQELISQQIMKRNINSLIIQANSQNNVPKDLWIIDKSTQKLDPMNPNDSTVNNLRLNRGVWFAGELKHLPHPSGRDPRGSLSGVTCCGLGNRNRFCKCSSWMLRLLRWSCHAL